MNTKNKIRHNDIDWWKGFTVFLMIYCHILQFFGDQTLFPSIGIIIEIINILAFPSFMFIFGRTAYIAYINKQFQSVWPKMLKQVFLLYIAFFISGLSYRLLAQNLAFKHSTAKAILLLKDIPGWSEFIISFALTSFLFIITFPLLKILSAKWWFTISFILLSLCSSILVPYDKIHSVFLSLWIGGRKFAYFPVIPYLMYPMAGIYVQKNGMKKKWLWLLISFLLTISGCLYTLKNGLPSRFPPSPFWIVLSAFPVCVLYLISKWWSSFRNNKLKNLPKLLKYILSYPGLFLSHMGKNSLYFLLSSNLVLFTINGRKNLLPVFSFKDTFLWRQVVFSPQGAFIWNLVLITLLTLFLSISGQRIYKNSSHKV